MGKPTRRPLRDRGFNVPAKADRNARPTLQNRREWPAALLAVGALVGFSCLVEGRWVEKLIWAVMLIAVVFVRRVLRERRSSTGGSTRMTRRAWRRLAV